MTTLKLKSSLVIFALLLGITSFAQNEGVSIKASPSAPNGSAMLDIESPNKGLLIPRVNLTSLTVQAPVTGTAPEALLVYNMGSNTVVPHGFYFWSGSAWNKLATGSLNELWSPDPATTNTTGIIRSGGTVTVGSYTVNNGFSLVETTTLNVNGPAVFASCCKTSPTGGIHIGEKTDLPPAFQYANGHWNEINTYAANLEFQRGSGKDIDIGAVGGSNVYIGGGPSNTKGHLFTSNSITAQNLYTLSDETLNKNITVCTDVLSKLNNLNTYYYNFKTENDETTKHIGIMAQQVEPEFPQLIGSVSTSKVENKFSENEIITTTTNKTIDYLGLTAVLLQAIKEQQAQITILQAEVATLKTK